jgi:hypothetical protein
MKLLNLTFVVLFVLASTSAHASIVIAYDDAADPTYNTGWAAGSNGGFGFGPWTHSIFGLLFAMGDSNLNGSLGGPGINVGGRAWEAAHQPNASGAVAGRSLGSFSLGYSFEIDVDFGSTPDQGVAVIDGSDFCQVQATTSSPTLLINFGSGSIVTGMAYSDGGYRVRFDRVSTGSLDVTITSFSSSLSANYNVAFTPTSSTQFMTLQSTNPVAGQSIFASRMQVTRPVPEPSSIALLAVGVFALVHRHRCRRTS